MEYCEGGDLQQIIKRCTQTQKYMLEDFIWKIFAQVISGLYYCHRRKQTSTINRGEYQYEQQQR